MLSENLCHCCVHLVSSLFEIPNQMNERTNDDNDDDDDNGATWVDFNTTATMHIYAYYFIVVIIKWPGMFNMLLHILSECIWLCYFQLFFLTDAHHSCHISFYSVFYLFFLLSISIVCVCRDSYVLQNWPRFISIICSQNRFWNRATKKKKK